MIRSGNSIGRLYRTDHYDLPVIYVTQACFYDKNGYMMPDSLLAKYPEEKEKDD